MKRCVISSTVTALLVMGCQSPMQKVLRQYPHWEEAAQALAAEKPNGISGLTREPFPNLSDSLHVEIWKALHMRGKVGDGFGSICRYNRDPKFGCYLVTVSDFRGHRRESYFYVPS